MTGPAPLPLLQDTVLRQRPEILFRDLEGESVLLDLEQGTYFGLNEVGTRAWVLLGDGATLGEVHAAIAREYDAPAQVIFRDLVGLVHDLLAQGLVEAVEPDPAAPAGG